MQPGNLYGCSLEPTVSAGIARFVRSYRDHLSGETAIRSRLEIAARFEVTALGTLQLTAGVVQLGATVGAGAFDLLKVGLVSGAGRHAVYRPASLFRNTPQGDRGWWLRPQDVLQTW